MSKENEFTVSDNFVMVNHTGQELTYEAYRGTNGKVYIEVNVKRAEETPEESDGTFSWEKAQIKLAKGFRVYCLEWDTTTLYLYTNPLGNIRLRGLEDPLKDYAYEHTVGDDTWKFFTVKGARV